MNGCTRSPTTITPLSAPAASPTATQTRNASSTAPAPPTGAAARSDEAHGTPASAYTEPDRQVDAARDDDDGRAHRHDRDEAGVGRGLDQRVRVEEVVDRPARRLVDVRARQHRQRDHQPDDDQHQPQLLRAQQADVRNAGRGRRRVRGRVMPLDRGHDALSLPVCPARRCRIRRRRRRAGSAAVCARARRRPACRC